MLKRNFILFLFIFITTSLFSQVCTIDTTKLNVNSWNIDKFNEQNFEPIDTALYAFEIFHPAQLESYSNINLGSLTSPNLSNIFINRPVQIYPDFFFLSDYKRNLFAPENFKYYKTASPYTDVFYSTSPKASEEQFMNLIHTQNINEKLNFGIKFNLITAKELQSEENSSKISFTSWFSYIGTHYNVHTNFYTNRFKTIENGGIVDTGEFDKGSPMFLLTGAKTQINNNGLYLNHEYKIGTTKIEKINDTTTNEIFTPKMAVGHIFNYATFFRRYLDNAPDENFYGNIFQQSEMTYDSINYKQIQNSFHLRTLTEKFLGLKMKTRVAISNEINKFYMFQDYIYSFEGKYQINNYLSASIYNLKFGKIRTSFYVKYYIAGVKNTDGELSAFLQRNINGKKDTSLVFIKAKYIRFEPGYFIQNYYSNHDMWNNNFAKTNKINIDAVYRLPSKFFSIHINTSLINNYIYFDATANPNQYTKPISISTIKISKLFNFGILKIDNKITYQYFTEKEVINMPELIVFNSIYFDFYMSKKVLKVQAGIDIYYTTKYYAYSYRPSIGVFYFDTENTTGNYPIANVFFNAKLKTVLFFFKLEHANAQLLQYSYSTVNHYPTHEYFFRFGIRWWFKN